VTILLAYVLACELTDCNLGINQMISVLFETPSGFAIFTMLEVDLKRQDALQVHALLLL
jgi:hypothetical protein